MIHSGSISNITENSVRVSLKGNINCEGCKAKAACGVSDSGTKEIEIDSADLSISDTEESFVLNEDVRVEMKEELGLWAVFWAYVFPFVLMMAVLIIASLFLPEWQAGLIALGILVPYYILINQFNSFFKKKFKVSIYK